MFLEGGWKDDQGISETSLTTEKMAEVYVSFDDNNDDEDDDDEKRESCEGREGVDRRHLFSAVIGVGVFSEKILRDILSGSFRKGAGVGKSLRS